MKFEEKIKKLEKYVSELEKDDVDLDSAIKKYTEAMTLIKECDEELKNVEKKIAKIVTENEKLEEFKLENWL